MVQRVGLVGCRQIHFTSPAIVTLPFYCRRKKNQIFPLHTDPLPSLRAAKLSATCLAPLQSFLHLPLSPVPTLERHSTAVLCWGFCCPQKQHFRSVPSPYFLSPLPRGPLILQHLTQEQQPGASCRSSGKSSPRFGNGSHMLTPYPVSGTIRHDAGLLYKGS